MNALFEYLDSQRVYVTRPLPNFLDYTNERLYCVFRFPEHPVEHVVLRSLHSRITLDDRTCEIMQMGLKNCVPFRQLLPLHEQPNGNRNQPCEEKKHK